jgi:glc operon protein GlcG
VGLIGSVAASYASAPGAGVSYIPATEVSTAFDKGAVLLSRDHYMVHASRREAPGQAEVHTKDTDIIYVLSGTATVVTGGESVDPHETAADEFRGASIRDGEERHLAKGDVLVVPEGVPHWFKEVDGPFLYYVVKVR